MDITVRAASPAEYTELGELTARAYLEDGLLAFGDADPYLQQLRAVEERAAQAEVLVAVPTPGASTSSEESEAPLGVVTFVQAGGPMAEVSRQGEGEFRMLAVHSAARRRGVGELLVTACIERARTAGLRRLVLSTLPEMRAAHRIYRRLGFVREPALDWYPRPDHAPLWVFVLDLAAPHGSST